MQISSTLVIAISLMVLSLLASQPGFSDMRNPLQPIDTSSPRATLGSFLSITDEISQRVDGYRKSPSRSTQDALNHSMEQGWRLLDLSEVPPAGRHEFASESFLLLWEVIARLKLPGLEDVPDESYFDEIKGTDRSAAIPARWQLPGTEITIRRVEQGEQAGEFLFSPGTLENIDQYYQLSRHLPYARQVPLKNMYRSQQLGTGWMIPLSWIETLPDWANTPLLGQVLWKWLALLALLLLAAWVLKSIYHWSRRRPWDGSLATYIRYVSTPLAILMIAPMLQYFIREQINVTGAGANLPDYLLEILFGAGVVWIVWLSASRAVEVIISLPRISAESLDAHLLRLAARAIGILAVLILVFIFANEIGIPVYGLVAGAGIGGIAIALSAQSTIENFMGSLNLFGDRAVSIGDLCRYDGDSSGAWRPIGRVESIGLRSTKIRRFDRTVETIPNAQFAQSQIINYSKVDRFLLTTSLGLRYETTDDQLRFILAELRELFHAHPMTIHTHEDPIRVRFTGFGDFSLNIDVRVYIKTASFNEFSAIREDLLLRVMNIVDRAGSSFAFPSRTVYQAQDQGLDTEQQQAAEKQVREWASAHTLPFPDIDELTRQQITDTLDYPPEGSPDAEQD